VHEAIKVAGFSDTITIRRLLQHQAGSAAVDDDVLGRNIEILCPMP